MSEAEIAAAKEARAQAMKVSTMSDIMRKKKPNVESCRILLEPVWKGKIEEKQKELEVAVRREASPRGRALSEKSVTKIGDELEAMIAEADEFYQEFIFQDIGKRKFDNLVLAYRPSKEQKDIWKEQGGQGVLMYDYDKFPAALVARACISPEITLEQANVIFGVSDEDPEGEEAWGEGDLELLFTTAQHVCKEYTSIPLSRRGIETTLDSPLSSTTALNGESPTPSS